MSDSPLRIALVGHGRMGRLVEQLAQADGHLIAATFTRQHPPTSETLAGCDVAVDFSHAAAVPETVAACVSAAVPLVTGTTGWHERLPEVTAQVEAGSGFVVYGANFSVGVHVFYRIVQEAARLFARAGSYDPFLEEQHHAAKKDAPSGTALALRRIVADAFPDDPLEVAVTRAGHIPGTHRVGFDGMPDQVLLSHTARSREGFARGALVAARWAAEAYAAGRRGVAPFETVMAEVLG